MLPVPLYTRYPAETLVGCLHPDGTTTVDGPAPRLLFPGSFDPLHQGHRTLAQLVSLKVGAPVAFEISITNVDKPDLTLQEAARRAAAFAGFAPLWLTRARTFVEKAQLFPGVTFVVGYDTAIRLFDARYYPNTEGVERALNALAEAGCRFIVGGRVDTTGTFQVWDRALVATKYETLFTPMTEAEFRVDVASRDLRKA